MSRTGATSPPASVATPASSTSYILTNSTASPAAEAARSRSLGAPTTSISRGSGAEVNRACCPGRSVTMPLTKDASLPAAGSDETAAGVPAGGFATCCGDPATGTDRVPVPASPGYAPASYPVVTTPWSAALKPEIRDQVKLVAGGSPRPAR